MNKNRSATIARLLGLLLMLALQEIPVSLSTAESTSVSPSPKVAPTPAVALRGASGASISFTTHNGRTVQGIPPATSELPHLVLTRNGALSDASERTLILEVTGIEVPPAGVTVTLEIETQHRDPDPGERPAARIPVWRETREIANTSGITQTNVTVTFVHEFTHTVAHGAGAVATPTDYFRYDVAVMDASHARNRPTSTWSQDYAFLMENQWSAPLPEVSEDTAGAAPDELVVYYCDMFPFEKDAHEPATRLRREQVTDYVGTALVPQLVEAYRVQTGEWGFSWHDAWTSYRSEDTEQLSVALTDERTWFHGAAPSGGHSAISIRVKGGNNAPFDTLTDGLLSTFHHELFHNLQRSISLHSGGDGRIGGADDAWQFFSEGTAVLAASVGQPRGQFTQTLPARTYISYANGYLWRSGGRDQGLNARFSETEPYQAAIYWRFLYEQCGGREDRDPAAGMRVIRRALTTLYSGKVVDVGSSTDLVGAIPEVMDRALAGSSCPFQTYRKSVSAFARALYELRLDGGRCTEPGTSGCGFHDPYDQYQEPPVSTIRYGGTRQEVRDGIGSSFGIDLIEVDLDPAAGGQPLTLEFRGAPTSNAEFSVQILPIEDARDNATPRRAEITTLTGLRGQVRYVIPAIDTTVYSKLSLIVTRLDHYEASDPLGLYTIVLRPGAGHDVPHGE